MPATLPKKRSWVRSTPRPWKALATTSRTQGTPFSFANAVGALKDTAEDLDLEKVSDLRGKSEELTIAGVTGCHGEIDCVAGLEQLYKLFFGGFKYESGKPTEPFEALETGYTDLAMLPTTDGRLAAEDSKFVILEDDKQLFPPATRSS